MLSRERDDEIAKLEDRMREQSLLWIIRSGSARPFQY
jgi:hypothetical protein